jgi:hypothetical protein
MAKQTTKTTLSEELLGLAERLQRRYAKAKAQEPHERLMHVAAFLKDEMPETVLRELQDGVEQCIEGFFGGQSTSPFQNAVARARTEGLVALKRDLDSLDRQYGA